MASASPYYLLRKQVDDENKQSDSAKALNYTILYILEGDMPSLMIDSSEADKRPVLIMKEARA